MGKKILFRRRIREANNWSRKYYVSKIYPFHIILKAALPIIEFQVISVLFGTNIHISVFFSKKAMNVKINYSAFLEIENNFPEVTRFRKIS